MHATRRSVEFTDEGMRRAPTVPCPGHLHAHFSRCSPGGLRSMFAGPTASPAWSRRGVVARPCARAWWCAARSATAGGPEQAQVGQGELTGKGVARKREEELRAQHEGRERHVQDDARIEPLIFFGRICARTCTPPRGSAAAWPERRLAAGAVELAHLQLASAPKPPRQPPQQPTQSSHPGGSRVRPCPVAR